MITTTHLKSFNGFDLSRNVIALDLMRFHRPFQLVDHGLILQQGAVVLEVDGLRLLLQLLHPSASVIIALLEGGEGGRGVAAEAELRSES